MTEINGNPHVQSRRDGVKFSRKFAEFDEI